MEKALCLAVGCNSRDVLFHQERDAAASQQRLQARRILHSTRAESINARTDQSVVVSIKMTFYAIAERLLLRCEKSALETLTRTLVNKKVFD